MVAYLIGTAIAVTFYTAAYVVMDIEVPMWRAVAGLLLIILGYNVSEKVQAYLKRA